MKEKGSFAYKKFFILGKKSEDLTSYLQNESTPKYIQFDPLPIVTTPFDDQLSVKKLIKKKNSFSENNNKEENFCKGFQTEADTNEIYTDRVLTAKISKFFSKTNNFQEKTKPLSSIPKKTFLDSYNDALKEKTKKIIDKQKSILKNGSSIQKEKEEVLFSKNNENTIPNISPKPTPKYVDKRQNSPNIELFEITPEKRSLTPTLLKRPLPLNSTKMESEKNEAKNQTIKKPIAKKLNIEELKNCEDVDFQERCRKELQNILDAQLLTNSKKNDFGKKEEKRFSTPKNVRNEGVKVADQRRFKKSNKSIHLDKRNLEEIMNEEKKEDNFLIEKKSRGMNKSLLVNGHEKGQEVEKKSKQKKLDLYITKIDKGINYF